jgi:hypothetical protein
MDIKDKVRLSKVKTIKGDFPHRCANSIPNSGISHDPIQRDFFSPLFLGAELMSMLFIYDYFMHNRLYPDMKFYSTGSREYCPQQIS